MPSKKDRIRALVKERGPISEAAIYKELRVSKDDTRRAIADLGGMMKESDVEPFGLFVIPVSPEERDAFGDQGYVPIKIRGR